MATLTGRTILGWVSTVLNDPTNTTWGLSELLNWLNNGQRALVTLRPDTSVSVATVQLVAGTLQTLPTSAHRAIKFTRNMGVNGTTPGPVIRQIAGDTLDRLVPDWHTGATVAASAVVSQVVYDGRFPKQFYVFPPQPASGEGQIEVVISVPPADVTMLNINGGTADSVISVDDLWAPALMDYVCFRALSKESDVQSPVKAAAYLRSFMSTVSGMLQADTADQSKPGERPAVNPFQNG